MVHPLRGGAARRWEVGAAGAADAVKRKLVITVVEVKGTCPVYRAGYKITLDDGYRLNLAETNAVCLHSLTSVMPYYVALYHGVSAAALGLAKGGSGEAAYVQCLDPCHYTGGGTVVFRLERV
ncbi:MAG: TIGR04076 family protein [Clostridia bacterium]|nr:TIGR04076 family protein [Clostridia bacterium]MBC7346903.1 TIGR04076 family protein [Clostridia bacterium]